MLTKAVKANTIRRTKQKVPYSGVDPKKRDDVQIKGITHELTPKEELEILHDFFDEMDASHTGFVSKSDLRTMLVHANNVELDD